MAAPHWRPYAASNGLERGGTLGGGHSKWVAGNSVDVVSAVSHPRDMPVLCLGHAATGASLTHGAVIEVVGCIFVLPPGP